MASQPLVRTGPLHSVLHLGNSVQGVGAASLRLTHSKRSASDLHAAGICNALEQHCKQGASGGSPCPPHATPALRFGVGVKPVMRA